MLVFTGMLLVVYIDVEEKRLVVQVKSGLYSTLCSSKMFWGRGFRLVLECSSHLVLF